MKKETLTINKIDSKAENKAMKKFREILVEPIVKATRKKDNPYLATSDDGLNQAFGKTKEIALENLKKGIELRNKQNGKQ